MNDHSSLSDLLPQYVLGILSEPESAQVEAWLAESPEAREELRRYQAMLTGLATTVPARKASAHLTADFRERLAQAEDQSSKPLNAAAPAANVRSGLRVTRVRWVVALAALVVIAIAGVAVYTLVTAQVQAQTIQAILTDANATRVALVPQNGATGSVNFVRVDGAYNCVLESQLPPLSSDKQYQLWMINDSGERESGLVFDGGKDNRQWLMAVPDTSEHYVALGITVEPRGGSKGPTTPPLFTSKLPS